MDVKSEVQKYFIQLERKSEGQIGHLLGSASTVEIEESISMIRDDMADWLKSPLDTDGRDEKPDSGFGWMPFQYFRNQGFVLIDDDPIRLQSFANLMRQANLENARRNLVRLRGEIPLCKTPLFGGLSAMSQLPALAESGGGDHTLSELCARHSKEKEKTTKKASWKSYPATYRMLQDFLGGQKPISEISQSDIERVLDLLERCPKNVSQKFGEDTSFI